MWNGWPSFKDMGIHTDTSPGEGSFWPWLRQLGPYTDAQPWYRLEQGYSAWVSAAPPPNVFMNIASNNKINTFFMTYLQ